jgi:hypothetical protein
MNQKGYTYLRWEVMHPTTPIVWRNNQWYELHHSAHTGHPYHTGKQIDIYPTPILPREEDEASKLTDNLTNLQIRSALAVINPSGPGSPHCPRSIKLRAPTGTHGLSNPLSGGTMSTQTISVMQTIVRTLAGGGGDGEPPSDPSYQS